MAFQMKLDSLPRKVIGDIAKLNIDAISLFRPLRFVMAWLEKVSGSTATYMKETRRMIERNGQQGWRLQEAPWFLGPRRIEHA